MLCVFLIFTVSLIALSQIFIRSNNVLPYMKTLVSSANRIENIMSELLEKLFINRINRRGPKIDGIKGFIRFQKYSNYNFPLSRAFETFSTNVIIA